MGTLFERAVHDDDPSPSACPERHDREEHGEIVWRDRVCEKCVMKGVLDEGKRTCGWGEHEQPDDHACRSRHSAREIEDETKGRADSPRQVVDHERQRHDEHRLTDQPDGFEQQHVFESGHELRQVIAVDEVPDTKAMRGPEREGDRIDRRSDAKTQEHRYVEGDEEVARGTRAADWGAVSAPPGAAPGERLRARRGQP